jgi:hypothetical protein
MPRPAAAAARHAWPHPGRDVQSDEAGLERQRAIGGEVPQPRPDRHHQIGTLATLTENTAPARRAAAGFSAAVIGT